MHMRRSGSFRRAQIQVVLTDIDMPGSMDALELAQAIATWSATYVRPPPEVAVMRTQATSIPCAGMLTEPYRKPSRHGTVGQRDSSDASHFFACRQD